MKVKDIIERIGLWAGDELMHEEEYIRFINEVDRRLWNNIIKNHRTDKVYANVQSVEDEVLVPDEYGDIYVHYILSQAMLRRYETDRASNHMALFNDLYASYGNYITRNYMPVQKAKIRL